MPAHDLDWLGSSLRVELAGRDLEPADEVSGADFGTFGPASDEVKHLIAGVRGHPAVGLLSPRLLFMQCALLSSSVVPSCACASINWR
jgi:hypothetical protein